MSDKGWVAIDRKIMDHWLWKDKPFSKGQAWIDLVLLANHSDSKFCSGSKVIEGKRGTVYRSVLSLAGRWGWDRRKVDRFLMALESDGMVTTNSTTHGTTITLVNYGKFQDIGTTDGTTNSTTDVQPMVQPMHNAWYNQCTTDVQQVRTYNNNNNVNNDNNIGYGYNFTSMAEAVPPAPLPTQDDLDRIEDAWNAIPHVVKLTHIVPMTRRYDKLREALAIVGMDGVMQAIQCVKDSEWMAQKGNIAFQDWINPDRIQELIEGKYKKIFHQAVGGGYVELKRDW